MSSSMKHMCRSGSGSNQIEQLCIEYPMLPTHESTPPAAILKPTKEKKAKGKAKTEVKAATKKKKKKNQVPVLHDSPAMGTRSKTPPTRIALPHILEAKESFPYQI